MISPPARSSPQSASSQPRTARFYHISHHQTVRPTLRPTKTASTSRPRRTITTNPTGLEATDARVEGTISEGHEGASPTSHDASASSSAPAGSALEPPEYLSESERAVFDKVKAELRPEKLEVQDISGGCGSMFAIDVVSAKFEGLSMIKQHRLVNDILKGEIGGWHGVQLKTRAPRAA